MPVSIDPVAHGMAVADTVWCAAASLLLALDLAREILRLGKYSPEAGMAACFLRLARRERPVERLTEWRNRLDSRSTVRFRTYREVPIDQVHSFMHANQPESWSSDRVV